MQTESIIKTAQERKAAHLPYAGEVTTKEAWDFLASHPTAALVDVRSQPEWAFTGLPDLSSLGKKALQISWKLYPSFETNQQFATQITGEGLGADTPIFFLCKTGGRSLDAACAMAQLGYRYCFNIMHGFEGDLDGHQHRGTINGWKASSLPWKQA